MVGICYTKSKECQFTDGKVPTKADVKRTCMEVMEIRVYPDIGLCGCSYRAPHHYVSAIRLNRYSGMPEIGTHKEPGRIKAQGIVEIIPRLIHWRTSALSLLFFYRVAHSSFPLSISLKYEMLRHYWLWFTGIQQVSYLGYIPSDFRVHKSESPVTKFIKNLLWFSP